MKSTHDDRSVSISDLVDRVEQVVKAYFSPAVVDELFAQVQRRVIVDLLPEIKELARDEARHEARRMLRDEIAARVSAVVTIESPHA